MTSGDGSTKVVVQLDSTDTGESGFAGDPTEAIDVSRPEEPMEPVPRRRRRLPRLRLSGVGVGVWLGLLVAGGGFGLIAFTWGQVASLTDVAAQVPYLVSGGLMGLGLILVGLLVVNLTVKRREALDRQRQLEEVREALVRLRRSIDGVPEDEQ